MIRTAKGQGHSPVRTAMNWEHLSARMAMRPPAQMVKGKELLHAQMTKKP